MGLVGKPSGIEPFGIRKGYAVPHALRYRWYSGHPPLRTGPMHVTNDRFPHRCNPDGTFDSTCTICFATVGNTSTEDELRLLEASHCLRSGADDRKRIN
jgi:hypothetical protein